MGRERKGRGKGEWKDFELSDDMLGRALDGEQEALRELWKRVSGLVAVFARIVCVKLRLPEDAAADVAQDVMLGLCAREPFENLLNTKNRNGWFYRVVHNKAIDFLRAKIRGDWERPILDAPIGDDGASLLDTFGCEDDPLTRVIAAEERQAIESFLDENVPKEQADVFRLYMQGYLQREIAGYAGRPINTVGVWISRIRKALVEWAKKRRDAEEGQ